MPKTVLITGASSGFGKDTALLFKKEGWNVAATMRSPDKAQDWATPAGLFTPRLDVTDTATINEAVRATVERFGGIDVLVNNAGFALMGPLEGTPPEELRREYDTNVLGLIAVTQAVLPTMREAKRGTIVNISSMGGRLTFPLLSAYHSTKFAVEGLTESLQYELGVHGVRVKLVEPGAVRTNFGSSMTFLTHPAYAGMVRGLRKMLEESDRTAPGPEKVAKMIYFAATDPSRRLRYPVLSGPFPAMRRAVGQAGWRALMSLMVRRLISQGAKVEESARRAA